MTAMSKSIQALAVAGGVMAASGAEANVIVNVPWTGFTPTLSFATNELMTVNPNVPNVIKFVGITGVADFIAGEGGTARGFATVGNSDYELFKFSPAIGSNVLLSTAAEQAMVGTLTSIRLVIDEGPDNLGAPDQIRFLARVNGAFPATVFQFEVTEVPEPVSVLTFLFGLAGLRMATRNRRREAITASA